MDKGFVVGYGYFTFLPLVLCLSVVTVCDVCAVCEPKENPYLNYVKMAIKYCISKKIRRAFFVDLQFD